MTDNDLFLKNEMLRINQEFESGKMRAFGPSQDDAMKEFQSIRQLQVALSLKQVALLGDRKGQSDEDIEELTNQLQVIANKIATVEADKTKKPEKDGKASTTTATNVANASSATSSKK